MAWTCSGVSNATMIQQLERASLLSTSAVIAALHRVDRGWFVPERLQSSAYRDQPLPLGYGATISAPHMHAIMLELLAPFLLRATEDPPKTVLDVGSGSGYLTVVLAELCGEESQVVGVEHVEELQQRSLKVAQQRFETLVKSNRLTFVKGDGRDLTTLFPGRSVLFDVIHVGAASASVPKTYLDALKPGGCLIIPVGEEDAAQRLRLYTKSGDGNITMKCCGGVQFVPLTSLRHQMKRC
ncbi:putative protein-l-isoaspartate o-methyltransferase [Trypanosoma grayi]|uniref:putative protein-l-isoaspartate o-methyltransferase n=1 Tax=Trypanosoma grayi TaxID=71804 RepID=UPI0004F494F4|nr:putative protein-l-isoaspartate o-methyltransferase [Trypanosoma grayi]KEG07780.1 putative protein-l-isoaspartate o-methyltransferase [Trypanosoma grayi]